jgi:hypothetical protein
VGTDAEPITFTSINDNTVGGATGSGSPAPNDWAGISATPSPQENPTVVLKGIHVRYARTGLAATTNKHVTVESDLFAHNSDALDIAATVGTNAAIHETWFDENGVALAGSSDWTGVEPMLLGIPIESCRYVPAISATHNTFGPKSREKPFLSASKKETSKIGSLCPRRRNGRKNGRGWWKWAKMTESNGQCSRANRWTWKRGFHRDHPM